MVYAFTPATAWSSIIDDFKYTLITLDDPKIEAQWAVGRDDEGFDDFRTAALAGTYVNSDADVQEEGRINDAINTVLYSPFMLSI